MKISIIQPSRNNLKYLKWSYESIRKNQGDHEVEICVYDDASTDRTESWLKEQCKTDSLLKWKRNESGERIGHTIGYDILVNEVASHELCMIFHADMYLCPGALDAIEGLMYQLNCDECGEGNEHEPHTDECIACGAEFDKNEKTIVSLTRIEPPLHPDGPEKLLIDYGVEPEEFNLVEHELIKRVDALNNYNKDKTTEGIFAPWAFWKKDFQEIGGHDPLYRPQSKEDSDIFNRFQLNGVKFVQTWEGFVYHMTCRGSRRNTVDKAKNIYEDSPEWLAQNARSTRNFIRKWGHFVKHDKYMKPIVPNKYNVAFILEDGNLQLLELLEPWCDRVYTDEVFSVGRYQDYIEMEQGNTDYDLNKRVLNIRNNEPEVENDIIVYINGQNISQQDFMFIRELSEILDGQDIEEGTFELGNLRIKINQVKTYTDDLIKIETPYNIELNV